MALQNMIESPPSSSRPASPPGFKERLKQRKRQMGRAVSPDEDALMGFVPEEGPKKTTGH
jgi:hypothetical protein